MKSLNRELDKALALQLRQRFTNGSSDGRGSTTTATTDGTAAFTVSGGNYNSRASSSSSRRSDLVDEELQRMKGMLRRK